MFIGIFFFCLFVFLIIGYLVGATMIVDRLIDSDVHTVIIVLAIFGFTLVGLEGIAYGFSWLFEYAGVI